LKIYVDRENRRNAGKRMSAEAVYDGCIQSRRFTDRVVTDETVYMMKIETRSVTSLVSVNRFVWLVNVSYLKLVKTQTIILTLLTFRSLSETFNFF